MIALTHPYPEGQPSGEVSEVSEFGEVSQVSQMIQVSQVSQVSDEASYTPQSVEMAPLVVCSISGIEESPCDGEGCASGRPDRSGWPSLATRPAPVVS